MKIKYLNILIISLLVLSIIGNVSAANTSDRGLLDDFLKFCEDNGIKGVILKLDSSKLKDGDYVQLNFYKKSPLVYLPNGDTVVLYNHDMELEIEKEKFNEFYTGYALIINCPTIRI